MRWDKIIFSGNPPKAIRGHTANFIGFLSPQEPLIGLGVLLVAISIKLFENYKNYSFAYGLILGLLYLCIHSILSVKRSRLV